MYTRARRSRVRKQYVFGHAVSWKNVVFRRPITTRQSPGGRSEGAGSQFFRTRRGLGTRRRSATNANANATARTNERTRERANERTNERTTWRSRRRCDARANARANATRTRRRAKTRIRCPEGLTAGRATTQMARDADSFFRDVFRDADDVRERSRARGDEDEGRARVLRSDVSSRLVSSRLDARAARDNRRARQSTRKR